MDLMNIGAFILSLFAIYNHFNPITPKQGIPQYAGSPATVGMSIGCYAKTAVIGLVALYGVFTHVVPRFQHSQESKPENSSPGASATSPLNPQTVDPIPPKVQECLNSTEPPTPVSTKSTMRESTPSQTADLSECPDEMIDAELTSERERGALEKKNQ